MGGIELYPVAILLSSSSDAQEIGAHREETTTLCEQHGGGGLPLASGRQSQSQRILPDLCPHFCDSQRQVDLSNRPPLS